MSARRGSRLFRKILPWPLQQAARRVKRATPLAIRLLHSEPETLDYIASTLSRLDGWFPRECPVCGYHGRFKAFGAPPRFDAQCGGCGSLERHRLLFLRCLATGDLDPCRTVLHIAPEPILEAVLRSRIPQYITADINRSDVDRRIDVEAIDLPDGAVDAVICNHVLEHVDDTKAMAELFRILKPAGRLYCMVPIVEGWAESYENAAVVGETDRELHFGQNDHIRIYGRDFRERLRRAGFVVNELTAFGAEAIRYGLLNGEKVFVCERPAMAGALRSPETKADGSNLERIA